ncbi:uracil-DNA glycosylase [Listeria fleischmannii subsp. fleischmannii LU2006-1]|nr:uracil-DNA glycosylase [Listeria fleischmannii subsp. fleischmannii LU2006-1]
MIRTYVTIIIANYDIVVNMRKDGEMMSQELTYYETPDSLVELVKKRSETFHLEGFVKGSGPVKPEVMLIGEAPGETEIHQLIPFSGRAGAELMKSLKRAGLTREDVYMTSAVRSRPYREEWKMDARSGEKVLKRYNRPPNQKEILAHAPILDDELRHVQPKILLLMGNIALRRVLGGKISVSDVHGMRLYEEALELSSLSLNTFQKTERKFRMMATFHPASIFYNRKLLPLIEADFDHLSGWLKEVTK